MPSKLKSGLYLVATPIGSARDITLRALDILRDADVIAAEDTRTTRKLLDIHGIPLAGRRIIAFHDHSSETELGRIVDLVRSENSVALVSEAGTPLIADPGYELVRVLMAENLAVTSAPGVSSVTTALILSGLPTDRFSFAGFVPSKPQARLKFLKEFVDSTDTAVFFETSRRIEKTATAMIEVLGPSRKIAICRELTKKFEQVTACLTGDASKLLGDQIPLKGEFVLVLGRAPARAASDKEIDAFLAIELTRKHVNAAAASAASKFDISKRQAYARALELNAK